MPLVVEATLQLNDKPEYPVALQLEPDTGRVFVVKETTKFNRSHGLSPRQVSV
jgi:hypothetical protein